MKRQADASKVVRRAVERAKRIEFSERGVLLSIKCEPEDRAKWHAAARDAGVSLSEFVRQCLAELAKEEQRKAGAQ